MSRPLHLLVLLGFAFLVAQGFQCASSGVTTARRAIEAKDFAKAKIALDEALVANPENCEALILLGDVNMQLNNIDAMIESYSKAKECKSLTDAQRDELSIKLYNGWVSAYNAGITDYNDYVSTKADSSKTKALAALRTATALKPTFTEPYLLLGSLQEAIGDTNSAVDTYEKWWEVEKPGFDVMIGKGLSLGANRAEVTNKLGSPKETRIDSSYGDGTLTVQDLFDVGGRELYVFSETSNIRTDTTLEGFTYNPPSDLSAPEKWRTKTTSVSTLKNLAFIRYERGQKELSLQLATVVQRIKPSDMELGPLRTQLLQDLGKTDEAITELKGLLEKDPSNTNYRLQYATLLSNNGKQEEAIAEYKNILRDDPSNGTALYNVAASYKNRASEAQMAELKKMDANPKYNPNTSYMADLKTAAEYFEKLRKLPKYAADIIVLEQLANTYEVLKDKTKVKQLIMELEGLEMRNADNQTYYRVMEGLYGRNNMIDKMKKAAEKADKLR